MSVIAAQLRDDVVAEINGAGLQPPCTAIAIYDIAFNLKDLAIGRVVVMPQGKEPGLLSRAGPQTNVVKIDVAVQYKFTVPTAAELDPYLALIESIETLFLGRQMESGARCTAVSYPHGLFLPEHMEKFRVFTSVVTLGFILNK